MANALIEWAVQECLKSQARALEHLRVCPRCGRLLIAVAEVAEENQTLPLTSEIWFLIGRLLREFRQCDGWPKGA
jgi:hypothetical protein